MQAARRPTSASPARGCGSHRGPRDRPPSHASSSRNSGAIRSPQWSPAPCSGGRGGRIDPAEARLAAAEALIAHLARGGIGQAERDATLGEAVNWIAHAARVEGRHVDDEARTFLFAALPDLARRDASVRDALVADVSRRMRSAQFDDPAHGIWLLRGVGEAGGAARARGALRARSRPPRGAAPRLGRAARPSAHRRRGDRPPAGRSGTPERHPGRRRARHRGRALVARLEVPARAARRSTTTRSRRRPRPPCSPAPSPRRGRRSRRRSSTAAGARTSRTRSMRWSGAADDAAYALLDAPAARGRDRAAPGRVHRGIDPDVVAARAEGGRARRARDRRPLVRNRHRHARDGAVLGGRQGGRALHPRATGRASRARACCCAICRSSPSPRRSISRSRSRRRSGTTTTACWAKCAAVLCGRAASAPARTDPFWKRLLSRGSGDMRPRRGPGARGRRPRPHGRLSRPPPRRREPVRRFAPGRPPRARARRRAAPRTAALPAGIEPHRGRGPEARVRARPVPIASDATRESAVEWLAEAIDESSAAVVRIAEVAGTGATAERARRLLGLFQSGRRGALRRPAVRAADRRRRRRALRYGSRRSRSPSRSTRDPAALDGLTDALLDPRFAEFQRESRGLFAHEHASGGGPLTSGIDPLELDVVAALRRRDAEGDAPCSAAARGGRHRRGARAHRPGRRHPPHRGAHRAGEGRRNPRPLRRSVRRVDLAPARRRPPAR